MTNPRLKTPGKGSCRSYPAPAPQPGTCNPVSYSNAVGSTGNTGMGTTGNTGNQGFHNTCGVAYACGSTSNTALDRIQARIKAENRQAKVDSVLMNKAFVEKKLEDDEEYRSVFLPSPPPPMDPRKAKPSALRIVYGWATDLPLAFWWVLSWTLALMAALMVVAATT